MYKYAVAYALLMISSFSTVSMAVKPFPIVRRQTTIGVGQPPISPSPASPSPQTTPDVTTPASRPPPATTPVTPTTPAPASPSPTTPNAPTTATTAAPVTSTLPSSSASASTSDTAATTLPATSALSADPVTSISTDSAGVVQTVVTTVQASDTASASPSPTDTTSQGDNSIKPGTIIGLSVAGGIAAIAVIAFIIWKLTRKRFSDLDDPDEAIKWPELNRNSHMGGEGLSREPSNNTYNNPSRNASTLDQSEFADPYAVPPLPQFNPNQPYRDDPAAYGAAGYYDPYRGPVPQTLHDGSVDGHESIPMSTYPPGSRNRSPGPGPSYDMGGRGSPAPGRASPVPGRGSPGPGAMYDMGGRGSPAPGRTISPGPAAVLGLDRRPSPGPQYALGGQPEMVSRNKSPGPNVLG